MSARVGTRRPREGRGPREIPLRAVAAAFAVAGCLTVQPASAQALRAEVGKPLQQAGELLKANKAKEALAAASDSEHTRHSRPAISAFELSTEATSAALLDLLQARMAGGPSLGPVLTSAKFHPRGSTRPGERGER